MNYYFKLINGLRNTSAMMAVRVEHSWYGYGLIVAAMEVLNEHGGKCKTSVLQLAMNLSTDDWVVIEKYTDFKIIKGHIICEQLVDNSERARKTAAERSKAGRSGMAKRWDNKTPSDAPKKKTQVAENDADCAVTNDTISYSYSYNMLRTKVLNRARADCETIYYDWMKERQTPAAFSVAGRAAMKKVVAHLYDIAAEKCKPQLPVPGNIGEKVIEAWKYLLAHQPQWGKYESTKLRLIDINSNLTNILNNLRYGHTTTNRANGKASSDVTTQTIKNLGDIKDF